MVGLGLVLATVVLFGRLDLFGRTQVAEIVFDGSVSGLGAGSPVTFRGVRVGTVTSVAIVLDARSHAAFVPVKIRLAERKVILPKLSGAAPPMSRWVAEGLRAAVVPVSLIGGDGEIELDFDPSIPAKLHPEIADLPEIPVNDAASGQLAQQLSTLPIKQLMDNANQTLQSMRKLTDSLGKSLPPVVDNTNRASLKAGQTLDAARTAIEDLQIRTNATLADIDRLTRSADRQLDGRGAELHALLVTSNQAVSNARDVLGNLKAMTDDGSPDRANLDAAVSDLSAASTALRGFATDVEQNPRLLLTGRGRQGQ